MARTKSRRSPARARARSAGARFPRPPRLLRPEVVGTALVVVAAAILPYLLPLTSVLREARDGLVGTFGVHVFTIVTAVALLGMLLALRRVRWLRGHARHLAGVALLLVFTAGLLGLWRPSASVGAVDLGATSAGGDAGRWLTGGWLAAAAWLLTLPAGFALLWPRTAARMLRATPAEAARDGAWLWRHGPRQALASLGARLRRFGEPDVPDLGDIPEVQALDPFHARRAPSANGNGGASGADGATLDDASAIAAHALHDDDGEASEEDDEAPAVQMPMDLEHEIAGWRHSSDGWQLPPIDALHEAEPAASALKDNARRAQLIVDTLASFGVAAAVTQINEGPAVTQFGVEPGWDVRSRTVVERDAEGKQLLDEAGQPRTTQVEVSRTRIRVNRITVLQNDLALALAAPALRIEAPVPGKSVIGIEVPNATTSIVTLRSVLEASVFTEAAAKQQLPIALGSGVSGTSVVTDLAEMPHLLIAGATGSGKSVCLNAIIACLLMNYSPEQLRLVLVDPKRVELTAFADIPHLAFSDIVVDTDKIVGTLQAVIHEMESRYRTFARLGVRNLQGYNARNEGRPLPYWVVVIDELADLMLAAPYQVEHQLVRLAQLARATGIHLVVATQRPSVDVVTGLIKANFPTRVAFAVASHVDSRTVLDGGGAEKLLGRGDMLYQPKDQQKPTRLQGVYVSDEEIAAVVDFWTADRFEALKPPRFDDLLAEAEREAADLVPGGPPPNVDPIVTKALDLAREHEHISTSLLQRRLRIGYPRAARVMDELEDRGVVGAPEGGGGSRPVLLRDDEEPEAEAEEPVVSVAERDLG